MNEPTYNAGACRQPTATWLFAAFLALTLGLVWPGVGAEACAKANIERAAFHIPSANLEQDVSDVRHDAMHGIADRRFSPRPSRTPLLHTPAALVRSAQVARAIRRAPYRGPVARPLRIDEPRVNTAGPRAPPGAPANGTAA